MLLLEMTLITRTAFLNSIHKAPGFRGGPGTSRRSMGLEPLILINLKELLYITYKNLGIGGPYFKIFAAKKKKRALILTASYYKKAED